jgi:hypothetical protein
MAFRFFTVPIHDDGEAQEALNAFLGTHKVLNVERPQSGIGEAK